MDERLRDWKPTQEEVERIRIELRPLIRDLARRDSERMSAVAKEQFFRRLALIG